MKTILSNCEICGKAKDVLKLIFLDFAIVLVPECGHIHKMRFVNHGGGDQELDMKYVRDATKKEMKV